MAKPLASYNFSQVAVSIAGNSLTGFGEGTGVSIVMDSDAYSLNIGADGEGARSKSNNNSATITINLMQSSDSNDILSAIAETDRLSDDGLGEFICSDNSGRSSHRAANTYIQKVSDIEYGNEITIRSWTLRTDNLINIIGGNA